MIAVFQNFISLITLITADKTWIFNMLWRCLSQNADTFIYFQGMSEFVSEDQNVNQALYPKFTRKDQTSGKTARFFIKTHGVQQRNFLKSFTLLSCINLHIILN